MKKLFLIITFLFYSIHVSGQWSHFTYFSNWYGFPMNNPYGTFHDAIFTSSDSGFYSLSQYFSPSSGSEIKVKATTNAALTWNDVYSDADVGVSTYGLYSLRSKNVVFHIHNWQGITRMEKTFNGGLTWINAGSANGYQISFSAVDTANYYLLYQSYSSSKFYINKYQNGNSIIKVDSFYLQIPHTLFFPDTATGYVIASTQAINKKHLILKSITGGTNWNNVFTDTLVNLNSIYCTNSNIGYAVGDSGVIIKTIDGGLNWQYLNTNLSAVLRSLYFLNDTVGFASGDSGIILRTKNGGATWSQDFTGVTTSFSKIFFVNDSIAFALTGQNLYKINFNLPTDIWELYNLNIKGLEIFPNPAFKECTILIPDDFATERNLKLSIYDNTGKLIQQKTLEMNDGKIKISLEEEAKGIYNVTLSNKKKSYNGKIIFE